MPDDSLAILPELARSLRTLGASADSESVAAQHAIFSPLLDSLRRATSATSRAEVLAAFDGEAIATRVRNAVVEAAAPEGADSAMSRARRAGALETVEEYLRELAQLDTLAQSAHESDAQWIAWVAQNRRVFARADEACRSLACELALPAIGSAESRRWYSWRRRT